MPGGLKSLSPLPTELATDEANIARDFYCPCLLESSHYARITGFFSSLVFLVAWPALKTFVVENGGRMQILCSPRLSPRDADSLRFGYQAKDQNQLVSKLKRELASLLDQEALRRPTRLLACLVAQGIVTIKLAEIDDSAPASIRRMFHDKVGIFSDDNGDHVGFRGSMNETYLGLSPNLGHVDSIDVFPSWVGGRDGERVDSALQRFRRVWKGISERIGIRVFDLPPEITEDLVQLGEEVDLHTALEDLKRDGRETTSTGKSITLRPHQEQALDTWEGSGYQGILAHATGSGKTVTGVFAIKRLLALEERLTSVIVVPSSEIQDQWAGEIQQLTGRRPLQCGGGHGDWRTERTVRAAVASNEPQIIIAVLATARSDAFISQLEPGFNSTLLIVDEVHRVGAKRSSRLLSETSPAYRLGLSATPERAGDTWGTGKIMEFFGGIIHRYGLADAIQDGYLSPYSYDVHTVHLSIQEQEDWDQRTTAIARLVARHKQAQEDDDVSERLERAFQERAKIKKGASAKVPKAISILSREYQPGDRWLVYCDNRNQLEGVREGIQEKGIPVREFHYAMKGDRQQTLEWLQARGGVIVSMKCLDEGVDIPSANRGLILASSTNEREFIQRRGRLLRKGGRQSIANLIDLLVLPADQSSLTRTRSLLAPELARAMLFAHDSTSPHTISKLERIWASYGLPLREVDEFASHGFEEDMIPEEEGTPV